MVGPLHVTVSPIVVGKQSDKYVGAILFSILSNKLSFLDFRRSSNFDHPVSKHKLSALE